MMPPPPWLAAVLLALGTLLRMTVDPSWVGDWNETGSLLGVYGIFGATLSGLVLALHARRDLRPLAGLDLGFGRRRGLLYLLGSVLAPSALAWLLAAAGCYAVTLITNPAPSAPSLLPFAASTLGILSTLLIASLLGFVLHPALAMPLVVIFGFLVPAVLGAVEPSLGANFSISTSTSLEVQFAPVLGFYGRQLAFFLAVVASALLVLAALFSRTGWKAPAGIGAIAVLATGIVLGAGPQERIDDAAITSSIRCEQGDGVEVCLLSDHARYLPLALDTAERISRGMPEGSVPVRYVERGIATADGDAVLDPSGVSVDALAAVVDTASWWRLCEPPAEADRAVWLAHRSGLLDELPPLDGLADVRDASEQEQAAWWTAPMEVVC